MAELISYSRATLDDLDLGTGTREVRLQDGALHTLQQIPGNVHIVQTVAVQSSATGQLTATFSNPAGARVHGVVVKVTTALGTSTGLTSFDVGDAVLSDRWGTAIGITLNTESDSSDFQSADEPIVSANYAALLSANGGNFDATGVISVQLHFSLIKYRA